MSFILAGVLAASLLFFLYATLRDRLRQLRSKLDNWPFAPRDPKEFQERYGDRPPF
jgi:hypothetical protein